MRRGAMNQSGEVLLKKLNSASNKFAIRVTLRGFQAIRTYKDKTVEEKVQYMVMSGQDDEGQRVSLAFVGFAFESYHQQLQYASIVKLMGGMVRIRDPKSLSTIPYDVVFDKYARLEVVKAEATTSTPIDLCTVSELLDRAPSRRVGNVALVLVEKDEIQQIQAKRTSVEFDCVALRAADPSLQKNIELRVVGSDAVTVESLLASFDGSEVTSLLVEGLVVEELPDAARGMLASGGFISVNSGTAAELSALKWWKGLDDASEILRCCRLFQRTPPQSLTD